MGAKVLIFATLCFALWAQEAGVPVVVDGHEVVVRVYGSVGPFSAAERVPEIERRITALAQKGFTGSLTTRVIPSEKASQRLWLVPSW